MIPSSSARFIRTYNDILIETEQKLKQLRILFSAITDQDLTVMVTEMLNNASFTGAETKQNFVRFCQYTFAKQNNDKRGLVIEYDRSIKIYTCIISVVKSSQEINKKGKIVDKKVETPTDETPTDETPTDALNKKHTDEIDEIKSTHKIELNNLDGSLEAEQLKADALKQEVITSENRVRELEATLSILTTAILDRKVTRKELMKLVI